MATSYKTPGVYVEEVSLFPPSIAQVETAVPAFIGYTQSHSKFGENLFLKPTKIQSLAEYTENFGGAPALDVESVILDVDNNVTETKLDTDNLLYDSLRLFFANGGSKCYIISIGTYSDDVDFSDFELGLKKLEKEDEPTLILFPDAVLLSNEKLYSLQQLALAQCNKLGDRFAVLDTYPNIKDEDGNVTTDFVKRSEEFRNAIGVNYLKYGAAYGPYLSANLNKEVRYRDLNKTPSIIKRGGGSVKLSGLTSESETIEALSFIDNAVSDVDELATLFGSIDTVELDFLNEDTNFKAAYNANAANTNAALNAQYSAYINLLEFIVDLGKTKLIPFAANTGDIFSVDVLKADGTTSVPYALDNVRKSIEDNLSLFQALDDLQSLVSHASEFTSEDQGPQQGEATPLLADFTEIEGADGAEAFTAGTGADTYPEDATTIANKKLNMLAGASKARSILKTILAEMRSISSLASAYESTYENALLTVFPTYKMIVNRVKNTITDIPPSGAIAGVYTSVDNTRGVFKSPANVSLNSVSGLTDTISHDEQQDLNVDVTAGKSINVIRAFTGKGILVWGARTLAGNDNEWRYVSVRRFFNMVEESTKKATEQFIFESNDSNTWVKVKSMIDNFLINQWRAGALAGATHEDAFFVKVGLNQTMTANDILEGRMIIEIGMAVVRPAEFIILRFSHKMQES